VSSPSGIHSKGEGQGGEVRRWGKGGKGRKKGKRSRGKREGWKKEKGGERRRRAKREAFELYLPLLNFLPIAPPLHVFDICAVS